MAHFTYDQAAQRVVFGIDAFAALGAEVQRLGTTRALVLATPGQRVLADDAARRLASACAGVFAEAAMHVPVEIAVAGRAEARRCDADCLVAVGGGSTVGLAKAIALEQTLPIVAVPTTYAGSEMTAIYGLTEAGVKRTGRDERVRPRSVIYDPLLTLRLPARVAAPSGMNALAHCLEALYAPDANPVTSLLAEDGIRALAQALPRVVRDPADVAAREEALYGAWLAGMALGAVTMGLHHKLCHTLGGSFDLPHAEVHTVILPQVAAFNRAAAPDAMRRVARALGVRDAASGLFDLALGLHAPTALKDIGMPEGGLDRAARLATERPYGNPRPVNYAAIRELLVNAYHGRRPAESA